MDLKIIDSMKKYLVAALAVLSVFSCGQRKSAEVEVSPAFIRPMAAPYSLDNLDNATIPVSFSADDFNWRGGSLTVTVYAEEVYDANEINSMVIGDTLYHCDEAMIVKDIELHKEYMFVNGGIENEGVDLEALAGGKYRSTQFDDHSTYVEMGQVTLPLSQSFTIVDCGVNPEDPSTIITDGQKAYLDTLASYKRNFWSIDTVVKVENSEITNITRKWIP